MSCVCILTPVVIAAWPAFSAAVVAAATSLGYVAVEEVTSRSQFVETPVVAPKRINLEIEQSELVTGQLARDQKISVTRDGVLVTFSRDARGKASLCVEGQGQSEASLRALGEELSHRVVQKYVYQRLMDEMQKRQFCVVEEETTADNSIRMKVRRWEN
ncbi:MAG: DUF1257 domain-containing protein [Verrucomicrobiota bacterium]|nr:DUF1257 domain-containing protein [Verrucomicrobiota bacterium]